MIRVLGMAALLVFLATSAWANCKGKDIKGTYIAYATGKRTDASACGLVVSSKGKVASGRTNCVTASTVNRVNGGTLKLSKDCTLSGEIKTSDGKIEIPLGSMDKGKSVIAGVFFLGSDEGSFTAVKHRKISGARAATARYFQD